MSKGEASAGFTSVLLIVAALAYPLLLLFVFARSSSPLNAEPSWGIAAEHGELVAEQWSQFLGAVFAAVPLAVASQFASRKAVFLAVPIPSLATALLYAVQPTHQFSSNDGWLANFSWQVAAIGVALAPVLLAGLIGLPTWRRRAGRQNVA